MRIQVICFSCFTVTLASKKTSNLNNIYNISGNAVIIPIEPSSSIIFDGKIKEVKCSPQRGLKDITETFVPFYDDSNPTHRKYFNQRTDTEKKIIKSLASYKKINRNHENIERHLPEYSIRDVVELSFETTKDTSLIMDVTYGYGWSGGVNARKLYPPSFGFNKVLDYSYAENIDPSTWVNLILDLLITSLTEGITNVKYRASATEAIQRYFENPKPHEGSNNLKIITLSSINHEPDISWINTLPRPLMAKIAAYSIPQCFSDKDLFKKIFSHVKRCAKKAHDRIDWFIKFIQTGRDWFYWPSERIYEIVHKFAYNHSVADKESIPWEISSINVVAIVDAMFIVLAHGRKLTSIGFSAQYIQGLCMRITDLQRRLLPQSLSRASLKRQRDECTTKTDSTDIFNLAYNRAIMLLTFTRIYASNSRMEMDSSHKGKLYLGDADPEQYREQVSGWINYLMRE